MVDLPLSKPKARPPNAKRQKLDYSSTITVLAGPEEKPFIIHRDLVCADSAFLKAACSERWSKGQDSKVKLPLVQPVTFTLYLHYIFSKSVDVDDVEQPLPEDATDAQKKARNARVTSQLLRLFVAGSHFLSQKLENVVLDELIGQADVNTFDIDVHGINFAWNNTEEKSELRRCVLDIIVNGDCRRPPNMIRDGVCREFISDLFGRLYDLRRSVPKREAPTWRNRCRYHKHIEGEPSCT